MITVLFNVLLGIILGSMIVLTLIVAVGACAAAVRMSIKNIKENENE